MAALNLYLTNALVDGWAELSQTSPGTDALTSPITGWVMGKTAAGNYASFDANTERTTAGWSATVQPDGSLDTTLDDSWRAGPFGGVFDATAWTIQAALQSTTNAAATNAINLRFRVFKSSNADGSSPTEITSGTILVPASTFYSLTTTGTQVTDSNTWSPGQITLANEYLFFQVAAYINVASSSNGSDANFRVGTTATKITTPNFTPTDYNVNVSGINAATTLGNITRDQTAQKTISGVSAVSTLGSYQPPKIDIDVTGNDITTTLGSITRSQAVGATISNSGMSSTLGSFANAFSYVGALLTPVNASGSVGTVSRSMVVNRTPTSVNGVGTLGTLGIGFSKTITGVTGSPNTVGILSRSMSTGRTLTSVTINSTLGTATGAKTINSSFTGYTAIGSVGITKPTIKVELVGLSALLTNGTPTGVNLKGVSLTGVSSLGSYARPFTSTIPSIAIKGVTTKTRVGAFRYYRPSSNTFVTTTVRSTLSSNNRNATFDSSIKFTTFEFGPLTKYEIFKTDRIRVFFTTRPNYYN